MKNYSVSVLKQGEKIDFESLPVAKLTSYPLEERDYKPYAQVMFCVSDQHLGIRFASFEVKPNEDSEIGAVFYPYSKDKSRSIEIWVTPVSVSVYSKDKKGKKEVAEVKYTSKNGEDLQGVYWGYDIMVPVDWIKSFGDVELEAGKSLVGNLYKTQSSMPEHYGSFKEVDWEKPYHYKAMTKFKLLDY